MTTFHAVAERVTVEHFAGNEFVREWVFTDKETGDPVDFGAGATAEMLLLDPEDGSTLETWNVAGGEITVDAANGKLTFSTGKVTLAKAEVDFTLTVTFGSGREVTYLYGSFVLLSVR